MVQFLNMFEAKTPLSGVTSSVSKNTVTKSLIVSLLWALCSSGWLYKLLVTRSEVADSHWIWTYCPPIKTTDIITIFTVKDDHSFSWSCCTFTIIATIFNSNFILHFDSWYSAIRCVYDMVLTQYAYGVLTSDKREWDT